MKIQDFLKIVSKPGRTNYFVTCSDDLGLGLLLQGALAPIATPEDIVFIPADTITKEKARQIEKEARFAPKAGAELTHFFIYGLQKIPGDSVGPLLKAVEEAKYARFIFQAQSIPRRIRTLMSRGCVVKLPFLSKKVVLGNMKAMNHDAKTADNLGLYDGTLGGTIKALGMKDTMAAIQREMRRGIRGITAVFSEEVLNSVAFEQATQDFLTEEEKSFLRRNDSTERKGLIVFLAMERINP